MSVFGHYSRYYDLLYRDKDYAGEVEFVCGLMKRFHPDAKTILDLGCGTGVHAALLAEKGFEVLGVDRSEEMLAAGEARKAGLDRAIGSRLEFRQGDIRTLRLDRHFDVVLALFHVISYQPTNEDISAVFGTVRDHLSAHSGGAGHGLFIFDCWYGPGVLSDPPVPRLKQLEDDRIRILRFAQPTVYPNDNIVDVEYHLVAIDKATRRCEETTETHRMRYLFKPEVDLLLAGSKMKSAHFSAWLAEETPGLGTWNSVVAAMAVSANGEKLRLAGGKRRCGFQSYVE